MSQPLAYLWLQQLVVGTLLILSNISWDNLTERTTCGRRLDISSNRSIFVGNGRRMSVDTPGGIHSRRCFAQILQLCCNPLNNNPSSNLLCICEHMMLDTRVGHYKQASVLCYIAGLWALRIDSTLRHYSQWSFCS